MIVALVFSGLFFYSDIRRQNFYDSVGVVVVVEKETGSKRESSVVIYCGFYYQLFWWN